MSKAPSQHLTVLARRGHADSLDTLLNYFMQKLGITARSSIKSGRIELILEGTALTPDKAQSEKYLQQFFAYLQIPIAKSVRVFAKDYDTQQLAWYSTWQLLTSDTTTSSIAAALPSTVFDDFEDLSVSLPTDSALLAKRVLSAKPLPFDQLPQDLQTSFRRAGIRSGSLRSLEESRQIYEMVPENVRRRGVNAVRDYRKAHDWSHKTAHAHGGSACPNNGDWEISSINRSRGARQMTSTEADNLARVKAKINFQDGSKIVVSQSAKAGGVAFGVECAFSGLDNFLAVQRGEKTIEQALTDTLKASTEAAITTTAVAGGIVAMTLVFPPTGVALATTGPCLKIIGGISIVNRLVSILNNSGKVQGMAQIEALMLAYGLDEVEMQCRDLEIEDELSRLRLSMQG